MSDAWPDLSLDDWIETRETLHLWTQMAGKTKLALCPYLNQWWGVALELNATGIGTGLIPAGTRSFQIDFDFVAERLLISVSDGTSRTIALEPRGVADFWCAFCGALDDLGIEVRLSPIPSEISGATPFDLDTAHAAYDGAAVRRWWRAMLAVERVIQRFRTAFAGKSSPVLFFWGGFDLSHTRFSGRPAPPREGADTITQYGESQENFAVGFWPGSRNSPEPILYAYMSPAPPGLEDAPVRPSGARFDLTLGEFVLPYSDARAAADSDAAALDFFRSAFRASAALAEWDLGGLTEDEPPRSG